MDLVVVAVLVVAGYFWTRQKRELASADPKAIQLESAQIKTGAIQAIEWTEQGDDVLFQINSQDPEFCTKWSQVKVSLTAEGMGVSGEAPGATAVAKCNQGRFQILWPRQIQNWSDEIQKTGDYIEIPTRFYVSSIELTGSLGEMRISSYEISAIRSQTFDLILK